MTEAKLTKKRPGNIVTTIIAIIVALVATLYFINFFVRNAKYEKTNDAQVEAYLNPVSARAAGYIRSILFEENQLVSRGDTLVLLDDREYRARLQEAEAAVEDAQAQLIVLNTSIRSLETGTSVNRDQVSAAKARLWQQEQDMKRYENLIREEAVTGQEFEQVKARYTVATSEYSASQNTLRTSFTKIDELQSRRALLSADLKRKMALLDFARINLAYTVITAPYNGRLGRKVIQEGQQIQLGQPLVTIINEQFKWVTANFKETQVHAMHPGQEVLVTIDGIPGKTFHGKIESLSGATGAKFSLLPPDNSTGNFVKITQRVPVKILFTDTALAAVKIGMNVNVSVVK